MVGYLWPISPPSTHLFFVRIVHYFQGYLVLPASLEFPPPTQTGIHPVGFLWQ